MFDVRREPRIAFSNGGRWDERDEPELVREFSFWWVAVTVDDERGHAFPLGSASPLRTSRGGGTLRGAVRRGFNFSGNRSGTRSHGPVLRRSQRRCPGSD